MRTSRLANPLKKIVAFYEDNKRMPSYSEIAKLSNVRSKNAAYRIVERLASLDLIEKDDTGRLLPGRHFNGVKLLGTVEAGFPVSAEQELAKSISLDEYLVGNREKTFLLTVSGNSMIEAGIMPGDLVLAERDRQPRDGEIVIAEIDHEWTMKYFKKERGKIFLLPANKNYPVIKPKEELNIAAVVKAVIRKYR